MLSQKCYAIITSRCVCQKETSLHTALALATLESELTRRLIGLWR